MHEQTTTLGICEQCGGPISVARHLLRYRRFCSRPCAVLYRQTRITRACEVCGETFTVGSSRAARGYGRFCSTTCYTIHRQTCPLPDEERFWSKVDRTGECWLWTGGRTSSGYGVFTIEGKEIGAHRYAYELAYGSVSPDIFVCHNCPSGDNPACVRYSHLFLGTHQENMSDMVNKGRSLTGERNASAKLTEDQVRLIRAQYATGTTTQYILADAFGVTQATIKDVVLRYSWKHVA